MHLFSTSFTDNFSFIQRLIDQVVFLAMFLLFRSIFTSSYATARDSLGRHRPAKHWAYHPTAACELEEIQVMMEMSMLPIFPSYPFHSGLVVMVALFASASAILTIVFHSSQAISFRGALTMLWTLS